MNNADTLGEIILLVDDNFTNIELLKTLLQKDGYEIAYAPNGEDALKVVPKLKPNLILLDIMMPGIDGFETCKKLKDNEQFRDIPVIFISAKSTPKDIVRGFEVGGVDYITKPFNLKEVLARVRTQLQLQSLMIQKEKSEEKAKAFAQELERSNRALEEFAHLASHDLQAPLRKIITFGDRLKEQSPNLDDKGKDYLDRMQKASVRMKNFIDDLLDFSSVTSIPKPYKLVDLGKIAHRVCEDLDLQIKTNNTTIKIEKLPSLELDSAQFSTVFQNLISNAIKYHRKGVAPVISLTSSYDAEEKSWNIKVSDNGIGVEEKYFERIFKLFQRLHGKSSYEGTGIGLAICQKIVNNHGGEITLESKIDEGSSFIIHLPDKLQT
ncbi:MAG: response regulator [Nitrospina sp.]|jgi:light-regulated signal transduction histidine kinase (bacteriophytochrome)|nr:response regulator [Nitrospina sp.]MBT3510705.1 response regulator [Nitrospina sp.]MBT3875974.1 response regulator [Nitrospina sp.]MBT4048983.1 response regulator [Nitrospina sp.]MBT4557661.1 response regulator [Nitrospina sp.]